MVTVRGMGGEPLATVVHGEDNPLPSHAVGAAMRILTVGAVDRNSLLGGKQQFVSALRTRRRCDRSPRARAALGGHRREWWRSARTSGDQEPDPAAQGRVTRKEIRS